MKDGVTVLICTFNGAERLPDTLEYLAKQRTETTLEWEVIVIDNASNDNTSEIAIKEWNRHKTSNVGFSILYEPKPGKINALELGAANALFQFLIICDDDNWLDPDYIQNVYNILYDDPSIGAVGGQSIAVNDSGIFPEWFEEDKTCYAVGEQGTRKGDVTLRGYLFGAGLGTRTELYRKIYEQFPSFLVGRKGNMLSAGEDGEYCQRLVLREYKLFYAPELKFKHYIPQKRLELNYRDNLKKGLAESEEILNKYYLITRLKSKIENNPLNKLRLILVSPFRALFSFSKKRYNYEMNVLKYLLGIKTNSDPVFNAILDYEKLKQL